MVELPRSSLSGVRKALGRIGAVVAEVDRELRYVWIDNPHADFDAAAVVGKRDDELIGAAAARALMALKREVFDTERPASRILEFERSDGRAEYSMLAYPVRNAAGAVDAVLTVGIDIHKQREAHAATAAGAGA